MNIAYEMLIIATLIVATLALAQGLEGGASHHAQSDIVRVSFTPN